MTRYMTITDVENGFEVFDLPDEWTDVHVTITNGTITAVPMRQAGLSFDGMLIEMEQIRFPFAQAPGQTIEPVWIDIEATP